MNQYARILLASASTLVLAAGCATDSGPNTGNAALDQYVVGYQAYKQGDVTRAQQSLESAVLNNPDLRMARSILGEIYRNQNNFDSAAKQYEVLSRIDPYEIDNHYYLGVSYQFLTRYRDAAVAYLRGLKLEPQDFRSNMNLGTVYLAVGETDQAVKYLDKATQIDPNNAAAWSNLGVALDARGSLVLAETAYRRAVSLETESPAILQNLANNLLAQRKTSEAIALWKHIVQVTPTNFARTKLAEAHTQGLEFKQALELVDSVLGTDPRYVPAVNAKAGVMIKQYELSGYSEDKFRVAAVDLLQRSLSLNGGQTRVAEQLKKWQRPGAIN